MQYDHDNGKNPQQNSENWHFDFLGGTRSKSRQFFSVDFSAHESIFPLTEAKIGERLWIVELSGRDMARFQDSGLIPGTEIRLINRTPSGSVIIKCNNHNIGLGANMTGKVLVTNDRSVFNQERSPDLTDLSTSTYLRELPPGTRGRVVGYEKAYQGYSGKLLAMGLTPGTEFTVIRHAPWGEPVEIDVAGSILSLRIPEANALCIEVVTEDLT